MKNLGATCHIGSMWRYLDNYKVISTYAGNPDYELNEQPDVPWFNKNQTNVTHSMTDLY
jgi:hypothetical protein